MDTKKYKSQIILESFEGSDFPASPLRGMVLAVLRQHHRETLVRARVYARWRLRRKKAKVAKGKRE